MYFSLTFKNSGDDIVGRGRACTALFLASQWTNEVYVFITIMIYKNASKLVTAAAFASESCLISGSAILNLSLKVSPETMLSSLVMFAFCVHQGYVVTMWYLFVYSVMLSVDFTTPTSICTVWSQLKSRNHDLHQQFAKFFSWRRLLFSKGFVIIYIHEAPS